MAADGIATDARMNYFRTLSQWWSWDLDDCSVGLYAADPAAVGLLFAWDVDLADHGLRWDGHGCREGRSPRMHGWIILGILDGHGCAPCGGGRMATDARMDVILDLDRHGCREGRSPRMHG